MQSGYCVAHSQNREIAFQSQDCVPISRLRKLRMHTIVDTEDGQLTAQQIDERRQDNSDRDNLRVST